MSLLNPPILNDRELQYGPWKPHARIVANLWSEYLGFVIDPNEVATMMILFKLARTDADRSTRDTWDDIIGYATLAREQRHGRDDEKARSSDYSAAADACGCPQCIASKSRIL